jgi:hypothetical protein
VSGTPPAFQGSERHLVAPAATIMLACMTYPEGLAAQVQWLVDREQIRDVLGRYARGIDRVDPELTRSVYHPDGQDEHGFLTVSGYEFADQAWRSSPLRGPSHHLVGEPYIVVDGDLALVESYFIAHQRNGIPYAELVSGSDSTAATGDYVSLFVGRYLDRFERRDGAWRIAHRKVVMELAEEYDEASPHPIREQFIPGGRYPDDPAYHHLSP